MSGDSPTSRADLSADVDHESSTRQSKRLTPLKQIQVLCVCAVLCWLLLLVPAWLAGGESAMAGMSAAVLLSLVPGVLVVAVLGRLAESQPLIALMGSGLRVFVVLGGCIASLTLYPAWGLKEFYVWVMVSYLVFLGVETFLVVRQVSDADRAVAVKSTASSSTE